MAVEAPQRLIPQAHGKFKPEEWQIDDLTYIAGRADGNENTANWSDMGAYKTSTVLWHIEYVTRDIEFPSVLICTTPSGKGTYFEAIPELLPKFTLLDVTTRGVFLVLPGGKRVKMGDKLAEEINLPHIILTHYHVFAKTNKGEPQRHPVSKLILKNPDTGVVLMKPWTMADNLMERKYDYVAIDEAHRIKNRDTKWTGHIKKLKADHRHLMTGTGFINRPDEVWSLLHFLDRKEFSSYWRFRDTYCQVETYTGFARVVGILPEMKDEFRALVRHFGPRRSLDEVMPHIKKPIMVRREVELNKEQRRMYNEIKRELKTLDRQGVPIHSPNVLSALQRLRQICVGTPELTADYFDEKLQRRVTKIKLTEPSSKLDDLMEVITELKWDEDDKQQLVVFSCFKDPLELLKVRLDAAQVPYLHMKESDNDQTRYEKWHDIFPRKEHQVFLSTLQLGSESINLTSARHVVFLDRSWSPKDNQQGIGRIRRPGQEGQPVVINIEAINTTDQRLEDVNALKQGWFAQIFGVEEDE